MSKDEDVISGPVKASKTGRLLKKKEGYAEPATPREDDDAMDIDDSDVEPSTPVATALAVLAMLS